MYVCILSIVAFVSGLSICWLPYLFSLTFIYMFCWVVSFGRCNVFTAFGYSFLVSLTLTYTVEWVSEWLLFNANSVIFQLYHGENKLIFDWDDDDEVRFVLDKHAKLDFYISSSLKQQSVDKHVAPLDHIILI